uniref:Uncharacterized protein n=1 Tax=Meloidogyne hapla TaxID=6305 RepID=A0A1I8BLA6_MELHA
MDDKNDYHLILEINGIKENQEFIQNSPFLSQLLKKLNEDILNRLAFVFRERFSKIEKLLENLTKKLFVKCDERIGIKMLEYLGYNEKDKFINELKEEMIIFIKDFDLECKELI